MDIRGLIAVFAGIMIFQGTAHVSYVQGFITAHPYITIAIGFILFFQRSRIADMFGNSNK